MKNQKVEIYSTSKCHYCKIVKEYLDDKGIEYTVHDVGIDLGKRKEMVEISGQMGVPVTKIGDKIIVGFKEDEINAALK